MSQKENSCERNCLCNICRSYKKCHKRVRLTKQRKTRKLNLPENIFRKALVNLINKGLIDKFINQKLFDDHGIDFIVIKFTKNGHGDESERLYIPIQIKRSEEWAEFHKNKYPFIPVIVVNDRSKIEDLEKKVLNFFLEIYKDTCFFSSLSKIFTPHINNGNG